MIRKLNHFFLHEDPVEITSEDLFYWYGLFGGSIALSLFVVLWVSI